MTRKATETAMDTRTVGGVFISYASDDRAIVSAAARLLRAGGATVFQDVIDIEFGTRWKDALFKALDQCERVMVFWSAAAAKSKWVEQEWRCALEAKKRIVPMMLDDTPLPAPLGEFHGVPDMVDMLHAAMGMMAASAPQPVASIPSTAARTQGLLLAAVGGLASLVVVMAAWMGLGLQDTSLPDHSRGIPDVDVNSGLNSLSGVTWVAVAGLAFIVIAGAVLYARRRRGRLSPEPAVAAAGELSGEFGAIGRRFTSALFGDS